MHPKVMKEQRIPRMIDRKYEIRNTNMKRGPEVLSYLRSRTGRGGGFVRIEGFCLLRRAEF